MGSHAKNNNQQAAAPAGPTGAGTNTPTPLGVAGPMTSAPMTSYLKKHPVSASAGVGLKNYVPGVSDKGPKLPGMAAGYDSHGLVIPQPPVQQVNPRQILSQVLSGNRGNDRGGYTTSGGGFSSSAGAGRGLY